jgi:acyl dehydratase
LHDSQLRSRSAPDAVRPRGDVFVLGFEQLRAGLPMSIPETAQVYTSIVDYVHWRLECAETERVHDLGDVTVVDFSHKGILGDLYAWALNEDERMHLRAEWSGFGRLGAPAADSLHTLLMAKYLSDCPEVASVTVYGLDRLRHEFAFLRRTRSESANISYLSCSVTAVDATQDVCPFPDVTTMGSGWPAWAGRDTAPSTIYDTNADYSDRLACNFILTPPVAFEMLKHVIWPPDAAREVPVDWAARIRRIMSWSRCADAGFTVAEMTRAARLYAGRGPWEQHVDVPSMYLDQLVLCCCLTDGEVANLYNLRTEDRAFRRTARQHSITLV